MYISIVPAALLLAGLGGAAFAQQSPQQSLSSTLHIYVFPKEGQQADQQSKDEAECYEWAVSNSGVDPFDLDKRAAAQEQQVAQQQQQVEQATRGAGARGAVGGAAAGALIGEIANDDASEGAAWGAAAGALISRRRAREAQHEAAHQVQQQEQKIATDTGASRENFNNAFSVCLEAKNYLVKF